MPHSIRLISSSPHLFPERLMSPSIAPGVSSSARPVLWWRGRDASSESTQTLQAATPASLSSQLGGQSRAPPHQPSSSNRCGALAASTVTATGAALHRHRRRHHRRHHHHHPHRRHYRRPRCRLRHRRRHRHRRITAAISVSACFVAPAVTAAGLSAQLQPAPMHLRWELWLGLILSFCFACCLMRAYKIYQNSKGAAKPVLGLSSLQVRRAKTRATEQPEELGPNSPIASPSKPIGLAAIALQAQAREEADEEQPEEPIATRLPPKAKLQVSETSLKVSEERVEMEEGVMPVAVPPPPELDLGASSPPSSRPPPSPLPLRSLRKRPRRHQRRPWGRAPRAPWRSRSRSSRPSCSRRRSRWQRCARSSRACRSSRRRPHRLSCRRHRPPLPQPRRSIRNTSSARCGVWSTGRCSAAFTRPTSSPPHPSSCGIPPVVFTRPTSSLLRPWPCRRSRRRSFRRRRGSCVLRPPHRRSDWIQSSRSQRCVAPAREARDPKPRRA